MKYIFICILLLYYSLYVVISIKSKSRVKNKYKKTLVKTKSNTSKKDGPLMWENLAEDQILEGYLKAERSVISNNDDVLSVSNYGDRVISSKFNSINNVNSNNRYIPSNSELSENQKSQTFRTVSPFEDSTKNYNGRKYSQMYKTHLNKNIKSGFYGKSRLTRL